MQSIQFTPEETVCCLFTGGRKTSLITLTEEEYCGAGWKKMLFKMLLKGEIKGIWFFSSFCKSSPYFLMCSFLSLSFSFPSAYPFQSVAGDFSQREFSEACQLINYFSTLFLYLTCDLLATLQNISLHSLFTQERFWEEVINWKVGKNYIVWRHTEPIKIVQTHILEPTAVSFPCM